MVLELEAGSKEANSFFAVYDGHGGASGTYSEFVLS